MAKRNNGPSRPTTRVTFLCDNELLEKIDEFCDKYHISTTAFICMACSEKVTQDSIVTAMPDMLKVMNTITEQAQANELQMSL